MISFQKLFGKTDIFYDLLEASAKEAQNSIQSLSKLFGQPVTSLTLDDLILSRRKDKKITEKINKELCVTFVTELEREDIEALSNALYKIPKTAEKIAERFIVYAQKLQGIDLTQQVALMETAAASVVEMVGELRKKLHLDRVKDMNAKLQLVEGQADKLMLDLLRDLYSGRYDPMQTMMLRDLYDLMEKVVDRCRDAGNVISHIVLKYS
ncbi:MAG: DUF47 family protein [Verrucomicrobiaceae bacterium]|nr:DUF47 family protein [Verrucomicrobiaceae bacterium]